MKMWKVYRRTDRQTDRQTTDDRWSEKPTWAFSSGELKIVDKNCRKKNIRGAKIWKTLDHLLFFLIFYLFFWNYLKFNIMSILQLVYLPPKSHLLHKTWVLYIMNIKGWNIRTFPEMPVIRDQLRYQMHFFNVLISL